MEILQSIFVIAFFISIGWLILNIKNKKSKKYPLIAIIICLIIVGLLSPTEKQKESQNISTTTKPAQKEEKENINPQEIYPSFFTEDIANGLYDKLNHFFQGRYKIEKVKSCRKYKNFMNCDITIRIAKFSSFHKLGVITYYDYQKILDNLIEPPHLWGLINCKFDRGLLYGCAIADKDPDGFAIIKAVWDTLGLRKKDLTKIENLIQKAYTNSTLREQSINVVSLTNKPYTILFHFCHTLVKNKISSELDSISFSVYEKENYLKFRKLFMRH